MNRFLARLVAVLAGLAVVAASLVLTDGAAVARPNCDVDNPPPICGGPPIQEPVPADLQVQVAGPAAGTAGGTATYTVTVLVDLSPGGGVATLTATVDPGGVVVERNESNNTASATTVVTVPARPDLTVPMTAPSTVRGVYQNGSWTMVITNRGLVAADPVRLQWLTDWSGWLNANYTWSGAVHPTCFPPAEYAQQTVNCLLDGALAAGASVTIVITAVPPAPGRDLHLHPGPVHRHGDHRLPAAGRRE